MRRPGPARSTTTGPSRSSPSSSLRPPASPRRARRRLARLPSLRARLSELAPLALPIAQTAVAAALAWLLAKHVAGHARPFFAPISATISLGITLRQRRRRTVEMVLGVSLGVLIGDTLIAWLGPGPAQIGLVVALAMIAAVLVGGSPILVGQAASSAVLVAALPPAGGGIDLTRAVDALIGGGTGLAVGLALPIDALGRVRKAIDPVLTELA